MVFNESTEDEDDDVDNDNDDDDICQPVIASASSILPTAQLATASTIVSINGGLSFSIWGTNDCYQNCTRIYYSIEHYTKEIPIGSSFIIHKSQKED